MALNEMKRTVELLGSVGTSSLSRAENLPRLYKNTRIGPKVIIS